MFAAELRTIVNDRYINNMAESSHYTVRNHQQSRQELVDHFGERMRIDQITEADMELWQRDLRVKLARSTRNIGKPRMSPEAL